MKSVFLVYDEKRIRLSEGEPIVVGRFGHGADIEINDGMASRRHAVVKMCEGMPFLQDAESANGVRLNDLIISPNEWIPLSDGDSFCVVDRHFKLEMDHGNEDLSAFREKIIQKGVISIGRENTNEIQLEDSTVSRQHAIISHENGRFWLEDLKSTNGTLLNGNRITGKVEIFENDDILISLNKISLSEGVVDLRESKAAISAVGISKTYSNGKVGLQRLSIDIPSASIVALMGPSGCGKSTLLKCLNGDNPATSGQVYIHGLPLDKENYNLLKKKIGYVPQDDIIHRDLTVYKTLYYAAKLRLPDDTTAQEIEARIDKVIKSLNLDQDKETNIRGVRVKDLSGGQRKRVSIAVELLIEPTILFLDEPTSPLDPESIDSFLKSLQKLTEEGTTIIMVTHKPEDLVYTDDVIFLMIKGYMTYFGRSRKLLERFDVEDIIHVYAKLSDKDRLERNIEEYYLRPQKEGPGLLADESIRENDRDSPFLQWFWLVARYFEIKITDTSNLLLLFMQPFVVGTLLCIIFDDLQVGVLFLMAVSSVWFGVSNSAKEIVGELPVYQRERMFNLGINTYVLSKWTVLALVALFQTFVFVGIIYLKFRVFKSEAFDDIYLRPFLVIVSYMFYLALSASLVGLFLSSVFTTTERVMTVVPISLMPQVMLAGLVARINDPLVEIFSFFTLGRWGTEGLARIQDGASVLRDAGEATEQLRSIISFVPGGHSKGASAALDILNYYDDKLIEDGKLIGSCFNSMSANITAIAVLNVVFYLLIYFSLKKKDRI